MNGPRLSIIPGAAAFDPAISAPAYRLPGLLAAYANKEGSCWPSVPTLGSDLCVSDRRVRQLLNELDARYIEITERPGHSSVYRVRQPLKPSFTPLTPEGELQSGSSASATPEARLPPPLKVGFSQKDTKKDTKKDTNHSGGLFERFWAAYPKRTPHANPKKPALQKFLAVLKEGEDAEAIIRGAENYAVYIRQEGKEPRYVAQATKFLSQAYWTDYQTRPKPVFKAVL